MFNNDFYDIGEKIFSNWIKQEQLKVAELSIHGGSIDILKFNNSKISESRSELKLSLTIRGLKNRDYFQERVSGIEIPNHIQYKESSIKGITELPFQKKTVYRNVDSSSPDIEKTTPALMLHYIFDMIEYFQKNRDSISGEIYFKKGTLSPFENDTPPIFIINSLGNIAKYNSARVILHLYNNNYDFYHLITKKDDISRIDEEIEKLKIVNSLDLKTVEKGNYKMIFSHKAMGKIVYSLRNSFSSSHYFENSSIFSSKRYQKIASHLLNIYDTPFHPLLPASPFDEIGVPKIVLPLVENGYLSGLTFSYDESQRYKATESTHNRLFQNFSTPNHIYIKGNSDDFKNHLNSEESIIYIDDIEFPNWKNIDDSINILSRGDIFLIKNGKKLSKLTPVNIKTSFSSLFMSILSFGEERESLGSVVPETVFHSIEINPV